MITFMVIWFLLGLIPVYLHAKSTGELNLVPIILCFLGPISLFVYLCATDEWVIYKFKDKE